VSIDYRSLAGTATEGQDYTAGSGRLEWADGEAGDRSIALTIVDDDQQEPVADGTTSGERFEVELSVAAGAALLPDATAIVEILDNDPQAPTPTPTPRASAGGGGSTTPLALLTLLALTACRRRHATRVTHAGCVS
jgi:hypothetical protein